MPHYQRAGVSNIYCIPQTLGVIQAKSPVLSDQNQMPFPRCKTSKRPLSGKTTSIEIKVISAVLSEKKFFWPTWKLLYILHEFLRFPRVFTI